MEINYVCSLGDKCHTAEIMKKCKIKTCSYPFDWIYSNCKNILHCLSDDFTIFLDKSYYDPKTWKVCEHTYYFDPSLNIAMFNHFNPLDRLEDYNYYIRCIERFRRLLKKEEHKLFIMTLPNVNNMDEDRKNEIIEFNKGFANYTDKDKYTLLIIFHFSDQDERSHELTIVDNIHFLRLNTFSTSNGVHFWDVNDTEYLVKLILETYNFNLLNI